MGVICVGECLCIKSWEMAGGGRKKNQRAHAAELTWAVQVQSASLSPSIQSMFAPMVVHMRLRPACSCLGQSALCSHLHPHHLMAPSLPQSAHAASKQGCLSPIQPFTGGCSSCQMTKWVERGWELELESHILGHTAGWGGALSYSFSLPWLGMHHPNGCCCLPVLSGAQSSTAGAGEGGGASGGTGAE